jgi:sucrose phosphorylase
MTYPLKEKLLKQLQVIYEGVTLNDSVDAIADKLLTQMALSDDAQGPTPFLNRWNASEIVMITYGDSIVSDSEKPLVTLKQFIDRHLSNELSGVHILPFFPYSSDDGFSVLDYSSVNESLGDWQDISAISNSYKLMADLVINHCSARSIWFENFIKGEGTGHNYFFTASPSDPLDKVVRPRTSPLLKPVSTKQGEQFVWCTFSHDQVDLDFSNPEVLIAFVGIIKQYLDAGVLIFRLDAIAFLWKEIGTSCINLPQTHEVVRLLRTLIECANENAIIITETNIPNIQNLAYFGNANEAHAIYNFSLPPLLIYSLISGDCQALKHWLMRMPPAQNGTCYFNFIASHDGIGLRPAEGLLSESEIATMVNTMQNFGGLISWRTGEDGSQKPYEMNIALFDALKGTINGPDKHQYQRFICAHSIMMSLEGIPGIYIHSLLGTENDYEKYNNTHHNRAINRHRWQSELLSEQLANPYSHHSKVLAGLKKLIAIRKQQNAFHPNATQFVLQLGPELFGVWRQCMNRSQSIFCVANITNKPLSLRLNELNLIETEHWHDLITGQHITDLNSEFALLPYQTIWLTNKNTGES